MWARHAVAGTKAIGALPACLLCWVPGYLVRPIYVGSLGNC
jgi:hypothetical protein